jgi:hypothetical protein
MKEFDIILKEKSIHFDLKMIQQELNLIGIKPNCKLFTVNVKILDYLVSVEEGDIKVVEMAVGDHSGTAILTVAEDNESKIMLDVGKCYKIKNLSVRMFQGFIRLVSSNLHTLELPIDLEINYKENISNIEYEYLG